MNTQEVANRLTELCRQGQWEQAQSELYADNCASVEPAGGPWPERVEGMDAIKAKGEQFNEMVEEIHGMEMSDPVVAGEYFTCKMDMDVTFKGAPRSQNAELCLYQVQDGKIVLEQFIYTPQMPPA